MGQLLLEFLLDELKAGSYEVEDVPEHLALGLGGSVVGRGEQREAEEEREKRGV